MPESSTFTSELKSCSFVSLPCISLLALLIPNKGNLVDSGHQKLYTILSQPTKDDNAGGNKNRGQIMIVQDTLAADHDLNIQQRKGGG